jgi:hypothetical protein
MEKSKDSFCFSMAGLGLVENYCNGMIGGQHLPLERAITSLKSISFAESAKYRSSFKSSLQKIGNQIDSHSTAKTMNRKKF